MIILGKEYYWKDNDWSNYYRRGIAIGGDLFNNLRLMDDEGEIWTIPKSQLKEYNEVNIWKDILR